MEGEIEVKEFLKKDLTLKILSIVFAVFLWFTINPVKTNYYTVPLTVINAENLKAYGLVLNSTAYPKYVAVSVRDRGDVLNRIKDTDFEVTLDLSKVKSVDDKVVELEPPVYLGREKIDLKQMDLKPKRVNLDLGKIEENPFMVQIETYGTLPEGYEIISKTAEPDTVSIQAVDTLVNSVGSVKAYVDITGLARSLEIRKECKIYNKAGEEILDLGKLSVDIKIEIGKRVPVIPITKGELTNDFNEGAYTVKPDKILITGNAELMAKTNEVKTEPIDIENATKTFTSQVLLQIPEGLKLVSSSREVAVSVEIIPLEKRTFELGEADLTVNGKNIDDETLNYEITYPITVTLRGVSQDLNRVTIQQLLASIDVEGLDEGTHEVPLRISLLNGVTLVNDVSVKVNITKEGTN